MTYLFRKRRRSNDPILILLRNFIYRCNLSSSIREIIIKVLIIKKLLSFFISFQKNTLTFLIVLQFKFSLRKYSQYTYIYYMIIVNIIYTIIILSNYVPLKLLIFNHKTIDFMLVIR